jgi:hypothetical protein
MLIPPASCVSTDTDSVGRRQDRSKVAGGVSRFHLRYLNGRGPTPSRYRNGRKGRAIGVGAPLARWSAEEPPGHGLVGGSERYPAGEECAVRLPCRSAV